MAEIVREAINMDFYFMWYVLDFSGNITIYITKRKKKTQICRYSDFHVTHAISPAY